MKDFMKDADTAFENMLTTIPLHAWERMETEEKLYAVIRAVFILGYTSRMFGNLERILTE